MRITADLSALRGFHDIHFNLFISTIHLNGFPTFPEILLRLAVPLMLGTVIGFEHEQKEHTANMLYC